MHHGNGSHRQKIRRETKTRIKAKEKIKQKGDSEEEEWRETNLWMFFLIQSNTCCITLTKREVTSSLFQQAASVTSARSAFLFFSQPEVSLS